MLNTRRNAGNSLPPLGRRGQRIALIAVGLTLLAAGAIGASMTALSWNNAGGGAAATAANWSPAQVPTSADDLTFNLNNTYTVTYNSSAAASRTHTYRDGVVTLSVSSPHTASNGITVGDLAGDVATTTLTTGTVTSNAAVIVGDANGSTGTLNVNDDDADLITTTTAGDLTVGNNGAATMNVTGGGLVQVADRFQAGSNASSSATVTVSGFTVAPISRSTLDVNGTALAAAIGAGGDVTMNVSSGALADFAGSLNVAQGSASVSALSIGGAGLLDAQTNVGGDLNIGRNTSAGSAGGAGTVNVNTDGALDVSGTLNVAGDPDGGTGTLHLSNGGAINTTSLAIGAGATLDLDGGTVDVNGGTFTYTNPTLDAIIGAVGGPVLTLRSGAVGTLSSFVTNRALTVGGGVFAVAETADFDVRSGASLTITSGDVILGESAGDDGGMIINGAGSSLTMPTAGKLIVAQGGVSIVLVEELASASLGTLHIAENAGSNGLVAFENDATVDVADVYVGGTSVAQGGFGDFRVSAGAVCNVANPGGIVKVWPSGLLYVLGGTLNADSVKIDGAFLMTNDGAINAEDFVLGNGSATGTGTINGRVVIASGFAVFTASGDLTLGDASSNDGFRNSGVLDCGAASVTLLDAGPAFLNTASIAGGTLIASNGCQISPLDSLVGFGTIEADIDDDGKIKGTGTGLTFKGIVSGVGAGFTGPTTSFIAGGGFVGAGTIVSSIFGDATSSFTANGALTMGNSGFAGGINIDGALSAGADTVTLLDLDAAELAGATTLSGGRLTAANGLLLQDGGSITGSGTVDAEFDGEGGSSIVATGALAIGKSTESFGFETNGALNVGTSSVTLRTLDSSRLGRSNTISGGTLAHTGSIGFLLEAGDSLSGSGTVSGPVAMNAGCVITATGALTMGSSVSTSGFSGNGGTLHVGAGAVTLLDLNIATLPTLTTIGGGALSCAVDALLSPGDTLRGEGLVAAHVQNQGCIEPGNPIGTLTLTDGILNSVGTIAIQIGGAGAFTSDPDLALGDEPLAKSGAVVWDQINITGTAALVGGTLRIGQLPGLVVAAGDSFPILTCTECSGDFGSIVFDDPYLENVFDVVFTPTAVVLVAKATTGVDLPPVGDPSDGSPDDGVVGGATPMDFGLRVSGRNPFTPDLGAAFEYDVPRAGSPVAISVYDASGRRVADLVSGAQSAGTHSARWNGAELNGLPSGVYFLRMDAGAFGTTQRLVLIR